eukprot:11495234-Heterocapsa_arctica.AAC.1
MSFATPDDDVHNPSDTNLHHDMTDNDHDINRDGDNSSNDGRVPADGGSGGASAGAHQQRPLLGQPQHNFAEPLDFDGSLLGSGGASAGARQRRPSYGQPPRRNGQSPAP